MAKTTDTDEVKVPQAQLNVNIDASIHHSFGLLCRSRRLTKGWAVSAALLKVLRMSADDREKMMLEYDAYVMGGEAEAVEAAVMVQNSREADSQARGGKRAKHGKGAG